ncbi:MAG: hypothetical protein ACM3XS_10650 [Bacteroidota bacterium]
MPLPVALETNGRGWLGFLIDLPGAFVRGAGLEETLAKVPGEARAYRRWLGLAEEDPGPALVVQTFRSAAAIEDGDTRMLLEADRGEMAEAVFADLVRLARRSERDILRLHDLAALPDWEDPARARETFYGRNPRSLREILNHVRITHDYYLSRVGLACRAPREDFPASREEALAKLAELFRRENNGRVYEAEDGELWTLRKILRRFVWHDRIHARAMARILMKQKKLGLIEGYEDPFGFSFQVFILL